jgi:4-hydroxybenzoate polyprenyltransferase
MRPYLQLCRFSAVFTALGDILLGYLLVQPTLEPHGRIACLLVATAGLYLSGMTWNDIFDRAEDAQERPNRPIPSGRVPLRNAIVFGAGLTITGLAASALAGVPSLLVALILTACIFLYDGVMKRTMVGPVFMGLCRSLNVLLGASGGVATFREVWMLPQIWIAVAMGVYIAGVTWFAKTDSRESRRGPLLASAVVINLGFALIAAYMAGGPARFGWMEMPLEASSAWNLILALAVIAITVDRRIAQAVSNPSPNMVQLAVKTMLLTLLVLDALLIYYHRGDFGMPYSVICLALVVPALWLGRWLSMT